MQIISKIPEDIYAYDTIISYLADDAQGDFEVKDLLNKYLSKCIILLSSSTDKDPSILDKLTHIDCEILGVQIHKGAEYRCTDKSLLDCCSKVIEWDREKILAFAKGA